MARKSKKKGNTLSLDFTDIEGGAVLYPEGRYGLKTIGAAHKENDNGGRLNVKCEITEAPNKKNVGKNVTVSFGLADTQLWVLRGFLEAVGIEIPEGPLDLDLDEIGDGIEFSAENKHNEYNDKVSNQWNNFGAADGEAASDDEEDDVEVDEDEDEDEKPSKKSKKDRAKDRKAKKSKVVDEDEEDEDDSEEDSDDEEDEDEAPKKKSKKGKAEKPSKKSKKSKDEDEDEDDSDDEEESDGPTEDEVNEMSVKELKAVIKAHKLDVDLDDYPSLRKQRLNVVIALEEAGVISN